MAASSRRTFFRIFQNIAHFYQNELSHEGRHVFKNVLKTTAFVSTIYGAYYFKNCGVMLHAKKAPRRQEQATVELASDEVGMQQLTLRELRFIRFASCEYDGQLYMTPSDFLDSLTECEPQPRLSRRKLDKKELDSMLSSTPAKKKGSTHLFRSLGNSGIISYTEYLFLLSVLTKPHSGFFIAFNMFDTDGNKRIDKNEYLVLERIFSSATRECKAEISEGETDFGPNQAVNTTLLIHLFGKSGKDTLSFTDFCQFMDNLQTEVLELEFLEYSKGKPIISEVDFARILLRYTYIQAENIKTVLERVQKRIPVTKGITFEDFKAFCQFLNNLDDFSIAMRMFTYANQPVSQEEFHRAVLICTGHHLDPHLVHTVFQIFDADGDGFLSYKEFIAIMRDRIHRGLRSHLYAHEGWAGFKACLKEELRTNM